MYLGGKEKRVSKKLNGEVQRTVRLWSALEKTSHQLWNEALRREQMLMSRKPFAREWIIREFVFHREWQSIWKALKVGDLLEEEFSVTQWPGKMLRVVCGRVKGTNPYTILKSVTVVQHLTFVQCFLSNLTLSSSEYDVFPAPQNKVKICEFLPCSFYAFSM